MASWDQSFTQSIANVGDGMTYVEAADRLRDVIRTGLLGLQDIVNQPDRFFRAHRLLAQHATRFGPGFFIRFTVHYNLFAGTVVALGTQHQLAALEARNAKRPRLGCFGLTECLAGVNSGLVVETTAEYINGEFLINTPSTSACKNWISQGLVADEAVVIASLTVNGKLYGPQAFLIEMRHPSTGELLPGISAIDMGKKTVGNDLDNARLSFASVRVPRQALLCRYLSVDEDGTVRQPNGKRNTMEMIGQRLFTGRVAVAQAGVEFAKSLFANCRQFANAKTCWAPNGRRPVLADVPQINSIFQQADQQLKELTIFLGQVESRLCDCLRRDQIPPVALQQAIAVGKVKAIEGAISLCFALKQEVGSYALMAGTGFEQLDFLQCCKFAEGDSRILMQKMARDLFRSGKGNAVEMKGVTSLKEAMSKSMTENGGDKMAAWDSCWELVYQLAEIHMNGILQSFGIGPVSRL